MIDYVEILGPPRADRAAAEADWDVCEGARAEAQAQGKTRAEICQAVQRARDALRRQQEVRDMPTISASSLWLRAASRCNSASRRRSVRVSFIRSFLSIFLIY